MIPVPSGVRVWLAVGRTDMRNAARGAHVDEGVGARSRRMPVICTSSGASEAICIDMSLYAKRLERGRFIWPSPADVVEVAGADHVRIAGRRRESAMRAAPILAGAGTHSTRATTCRELAAY